ncbi:unnamed protein product [Agarophyton chilense]
MVILGKSLLRVTLCAYCFSEVFYVSLHIQLTPKISPRFQTLGMQFVSFVNANCDVDVVIANSTQFVSLMLKLVNNDTHGAPSFSEKLRGFRYTVLSDLALRVPSVIHDQSVPLQLFLTGSQSRTHPQDIRTAVFQALFTLSRIVSFVPTDKIEFRTLVVSTLVNPIEDEEDISMTAESAAVH